MAKQIIILEQLSPTSWRYAMWATVITARQSFYADPTKISAYKAASGPELADIQAGRVVEAVGTVSKPSASTIADIQVDLQNQYALYQTEVNNNQWPGRRYGSNWDGTTWTVVNIT